MLNPSEFPYGQQQRPMTGDKNGSQSRANNIMNGSRAVNVYAEQSRGLDQDEHGDARKRGFWAAFCCRA